MIGPEALVAFDELVDSIRYVMASEGRAATGEEVQAVLDAFAEIRAENERRRRWAEERDVVPLNLIELPDIRAVRRELEVAPEPPRPVMLRSESVREIADAVASAVPRAARAAKGPTNDEGGGRPHKSWPRLAIAEATRMWVKGAHRRSIRKISEEVTRKVVDNWDAQDLAAHGWTEDRPFKFTREAMKLVVAAVEAGLLKWDDEKELGVLHQFSATREWLPIPRRKPAS